MKNNIFLAVRIFFGIFLLIFGFDHFFGYLPFPEMSAAANGYFIALVSTGVMQLVGIIEIAAGIAFISNRYGAFMAFLLMSVSVNAVLFHVFLDPEKIIIAIALLALNMVMLFYYKNQYGQILKSRG